MPGSVEDVAVTALKEDACAPKEAAALLSLGNPLELLPSAPLSHKNGCNLRKLCSRQAILLESEGSLIFFSYISS